MNHSIRVSACAASLFLAGCAAPGYYGQPVAQSYPAPVRGYPAQDPAYAASYGTVESIAERPDAGTGAGNGAGLGMGTVVGGVVGGIVGNQVGGGRGRSAATVAGVIGGAMIGNRMERDSQRGERFQVGVRLDNGAYRTFLQENIADLHVGSRVRIDKDRAYRY